MSNITNSNKRANNTQSQLETSLSDVGGVAPAKTAKATDRDPLAANVPLPLPGAARLPVGEVGDDATLAGAAWAAYAVPLARLVMARYVNRADVYGGYNQLRKRGREYLREDGRKGTHGKTTTRKCGPLTVGTLERHFRAGVMGAGIHKWDDWLNLAPACIVGAHTASPDNLSLTTTSEVDAHDLVPGSAEAIEAKAGNERGVITAYDFLRSLGFHPLLWSSDENGGFHLDILHCRPVPTNVSYAFGQWLRAKWGEWGLPAKPEAFPKQPCLSPGRPFGNWVRIIGRHHTRNVWPRVRNDQQWLERDAAARFVVELLSGGGDDPTLIPAEVYAAAAEELERPKSKERQACPGPKPAGKLPAGFDGVSWHWTEGHRHENLLRVAGGVRAEGGEADDIFDRLKEVNTERCRPPKDEALLRAMADDVARRYPVEAPDPPAAVLTSPRPELAEAEREAIRAENAAAAAHYRRADEAARRSTAALALAVLGRYFGWRKAFHKEHDQRWGWCGLTGDTVFERIDSPHRGFCAGKNCKHEACDFCFGRKRTKQVACLTTAILAESPRARPDEARPTQINILDSERPWDELPDSTWRTGPVYVWRGTRRKYHAANRRMRRAWDKAVAMRVAKGEDVSTFGAARIGRVDPDAPNDSPVELHADFSFGGAVQMTASDAAKSALTAAWELPRDAHTIRLFGAWAVKPVALYRQRARLAPFGGVPRAKPLAEVVAEQRERFEEYREIAEACGVAVPNGRGDKEESESDHLALMPYEMNDDWTPDMRERFHDALLLGIVRDHPLDPRDFEEQEECPENGDNYSRILDTLEASWAGADLETVGSSP